MEQKLHDELLKFTTHLASLNIWDYGKDDGSNYQECEEPSDGYLDSHTCLMDLIETARRITGDQSESASKDEESITDESYYLQLSPEDQKAYMPDGSIPEFDDNGALCASPPSESVTLVAEAYTTCEHGDSPAFAVINVTPAFLAKLMEYREMCKVHGVQSVTTGDCPESWDNDDDLRIRYDSLQVFGDDFWFSGNPKHADYGVETRGISITDLLRVLETKKNDPAYPNYRWDDGVLFYAGDSGYLVDLIDQYKA